MKEEWKIIDAWPDYKISNYGEVYSVRRGRLLKLATDRYGYINVNLARDGKWSKVNVHRLVAIAFVDGYFEGAEVNHKDGIKQNINAENLEWVTHIYNIQHAFSTGLNTGRGVRRIYIEEDKHGC